MVPEPRAAAPAPYRLLNPILPVAMILTLLAGDAVAQTTAQGIFSGPNFRIYPGLVTQTEPFVAKHPHDDRILFVAANTIDPSTGFISEGVYSSADGGITWRGSDTCAGAPVQFHMGDPGIAVDRNGTFILTRLGFIPGLYSHRSTDQGATWSAQLQVMAEDQDRAAVVTDGNPSSAGYGRTYAAWVRFAPPFPVYFASTADGGSSWSTPEVVNSPPQRCQGADIAMGPSGEVYVCWAAVIPTSPFTEDAVGFASSTDAGSSWDVTEAAFDINGISGTLPQKANIRVNGLPRIDADRSGGARNGRIYIVTTQKDLPPAGSDPDIILYSSADSGRSWSAPVRVNQDPVNNGKTQYFPVVHVDGEGGVNVLYYSDAPTSSDSAAVVLARSADGGNTWTETEVGDHRFKPQPIGGLGAGYQGDNIALTSVGDTLWPFWMDNSTGIYQVWTAAVRISSLVSVGATDPLPGGYGLENCYPNPFNPSTTITFSIPRREFVTLEVRDLQGRKVATLLSAEIEAGTHRAGFSPGPDALPAGIYFYRLLTPSWSGAGKMLYVK